MPPDGTDYLLELATTTPSEHLVRLIGELAQASAIAHMRLLKSESTSKIETSSFQLIDRKQAAAMLAVSTYYLEGKRLPGCEQRIGKKVLYDRQKLETYVRRGHIPFESR